MTALLSRVLLTAAAYGLATLAGSPGWARWDTSIVVWCVFGGTDYTIARLKSRGGKR